jgi:hypothetical protein
MKVSSKVIFYLLMLIPAGIAAQQVNTVKPFNNSFSLSLPLDCPRLTEAEAAKLYPVVSSRPGALYGTSSRDLLVSLSLTTQKVAIDKMIAEKSKLVEGMKTRPMVTWVSDEVKTVNGRQYIICTFSKTSPTGQTNFNKAFFTSLNGTLLLGTISIQIDINAAQKSKMDSIIASFKM